MIALVCENSMCTKRIGSGECDCNENESHSSDTSCDSSIALPRSATSIQDKNLLATMLHPVVSATLLAAVLTTVSLYSDHVRALIDTINFAIIDQLITSASTLADKISNTGFYQAFSLVLISEIGDKTFFIAGLLAMKSGKVVSFMGSISALAAMTFISVIIGQLFHAVPVRISQGIPFKDLSAVLAFAFFGIKTLKEASEVKDGVSGIEEEYADAKEAVKGSRTIRQVTAWCVAVP